MELALSVLRREVDPTLIDRTELYGVNNGSRAYIVSPENVGISPARIVYSLMNYSPQDYAEVRYLRAKLSLMKCSQTIHKSC